MHYKPRRSRRAPRFMRMPCRTNHPALISTRTVPLHEKSARTLHAIPPSHRSYTAARGAGVDANRPARATPKERRRRRNREGGASEITSKEARRCANLKASGGTCEARNEAEEAGRGDHLAWKPHCSCSFFSSQRQARQAHVWKRSIPRRHAQRQERICAAHRSLGR